MSSDQDKKAKQDQELFKQAVAGAKRLRQNRVMPAKPRPRPMPEQSQRDERRVIENLLADTVALEDIETGDELVFLQSGIQKSILRRLRRGDYTIEAELDLHGRTVPEARQALIRFIRNSQTNGLRCIRVIHGKGLRSPGRQPILKNKTDLWLRQRQEVLAYCSARPVDGGTGAVYVLLKKLVANPAGR